MSGVVKSGLQNLRNIVTIMLAQSSSLTKSEQTGEEVNQIQAWVHTHRGTDKNKPLILNTPEATKCLALYTKKAKELNGENYDTLKNDVSSKALYNCSNGKPHGKWPLFNGIVNDTEVIAEVRATGTSSAALKRRRAEEIEDVLRKEFEKARKAEAYANNILSCGVGMYEHCNGIQKFLQSFATNQGVPIGEIPPPPVPPPAHCLLLDLHNNLLSKDLKSAQMFLLQQTMKGSMFGGFFSQCGTGALSLSLLGSQPVP